MFCCSAVVTSFSTEWVGEARVRPAPAPRVLVETSADRHLTIDALLETVQQICLQSVVGEHKPIVQHLNVREAIDIPTEGHRAIVRPHLADPCPSATGEHERRARSLELKVLEVVVVAAEVGVHSVLLEHRAPGLDEVNRVACDVLRIGCDALQDSRDVQARLATEPEAIRVTGLVRPVLAEDSDAEPGAALAHSSHPH